MRFRRFMAFFVFGVCGIAMPWAAMGQWAKQEIALQPGWNAIHLEVQPVPESCDSQFQDLPVEGLWYGYGRGTAMQYYDDPAQMVSNRTVWMAYYPPSSSMRAAADLFQLMGGCSYLLKLSGTKSVTWKVTGQLANRAMSWTADAKNFAGFCVSGDSPPTFADFFASSPAHAGQPVYRLNSSTGKWEAANPATAHMRRGEAFWIATQGASSFQGPVEVKSSLGDGLEFGSRTVEIEIAVTNRSSQTRMITFSEMPSADRPSSDSKVIAGSVPMSYLFTDWESGASAWRPLTDSYTPKAKAGQTLRVRFQVRRRDFASPPPDADFPPFYQSLLRITDDAGFLQWLPVSSYGLGVTLAHPHSNMPYALRMGLWVGTVQVGSVCETNNVEDRETPKAAASSFNFPLIVHVDSQSNLHLLSEVYVVKKPAVTAADPDNPGQTKIVEPARLVLLTDQTKIAQYQNSAGQNLVSRRFCSAAFGASPPDATQSSAHHHSLNSTQFPVDLVAETDETSPILSSAIVIDYDDPLNPFKHKYHPDHDNLTERFDAQLPEGGESYEINRTVRLEFTRDDPFKRTSLSGWGDTIVGGVYREKAGGIHRYPIYSQGVFILHYIVGTSTLNDP